MNFKKKKRQLLNNIREQMLPVVRSRGDTVEKGSASVDKSREKSALKVPTPCPTPKPRRNRTRRHTWIRRLCVSATGKSLDFTQTLLSILLYSLFFVTNTNIFSTRTNQCFLEREENKASDCLLATCHVHKTISCTQTSTHTHTHNHSHALRLATHAHKINTKHTSPFWSN